MGRKLAFVFLSVLLAIGYIQAAPLGGAKLSLVDANGKPLTDYGKVYYTVWTFDENGDIKVLSRGSLEKRFIFSNNVVKLSSSNFEMAKEIARKKASKTAFIGVDVWVVKNGKLYTLPPESFETGLTENTLAKTFKLKINLKEARVKEVGKLGTKIIQPMAHDVYYIWETVKQKSYTNVRIPLLIIHNKAGSEVFGTADIAVQIQKYWGPDVTVAFGDQISKKVRFDPSSITVKVLSRSITDYYAGGHHITVPPYSWGYVWVKGTVHYIYQKEYICTAWCYPTGNERYFAKIDDFTIKETINGIKNIESGSILGRPPYNFPDEWMKKSTGITRRIGQDVYVENFYGTIYAGSDGRSFGVGVPVGAMLEYFAGDALPG